MATDARFLNYNGLMFIITLINRDRIKIKRIGHTFKIISIASGDTLLNRLWTSEYTLGTTMEDDVNRDIGTHINNLDHQPTHLEMGLIDLRKLSIISKLLDSFTLTCMCLRKFCKCFTNKTPNNLSRLERPKLLKTLYP